MANLQNAKIMGAGAARVSRRGVDDLRGPCVGHDKLDMTENNYCWIRIKSLLTRENLLLLRSLVCGDFVRPVQPCHVYHQDGCAAMSCLAMSHRTKFGPSILNLFHTKLVKHQGKVICHSDHVKKYHGPRK